MATDFPVAPVDRLPIFTDEASNSAILMEMVGDGAQPEGCSGGNLLDGQISVGACGEETSVDAAGGEVSHYSESEGDNADVIEQGDATRKEEQAEMQLLLILQEKWIHSRVDGQEG